MGDGMVTHRLGTHFHIHAGIELVTNRNRSIDELAVMACHLRLNLLGILDFKTRIIPDQCANVAHLTAGFSIKRRRIEYDDTALACLNFFHRCPVTIQGHDSTCLFQPFVTDELRFFTVIFQSGRHLEFA